MKTLLVLYTLFPFIGWGQETQSGILSKADYSVWDKIVRKRDSVLSLTHMGEGQAPILASGKLNIPQYSSTVTRADFKGIPPKNEPCIAARTSTIISMTYGPTANSRFEIKVWASLLSEESWIRVLSEDVLRHETTHWRIALLQAAHCSSALSKYQDKENPPTDKIDSIFDHYQKEIDRINANFDKETNHGLNKESEEKWEQSIYRQLNAVQP